VAFRGAKLRGTAVSTIGATVAGDLLELRDFDASRVIQR
jgi:hypothetical protein